MAPLARVRALIAVFPGVSFPLPVLSVLSSVRSRGPSCREFVSPLARSRWRSRGPFPSPCGRILFALGASAPTSAVSLTVWARTPIRVESGPF